MNWVALRRAARIVLATMMAASLAVAGWNAWQLATNPVVDMLVERTTSEIEAGLDALLASGASAEQMAARLDALVTETPRDWARIDAVTGLAEARGVALPPETAAAVAAARAEDDAWASLATACAACLWDFDSCSFSNVFVCRVPVEMTVVGDLASVARESVNYARGEAVDAVDLLLSTVGIGAVVIAPLVGGTSLGLKVAASLTKTAYRMGALGAGVVAEAARAARRAIDWQLLARRRPGRLLDDLAKAVRPEALQPVADFLRHVDTTRDAIGARWTLFVLRKVDSPQDARRMAAVAKAGKAKTAGALEMLGLKRLLRIAVRWSDEVWQLATAAASALFSILMLALTLTKSVTLRGLRRLAQEPVGRRRRWWLPD